MASTEKLKLKDGDFCKVVGGTHKGKSGTVQDMNTRCAGFVILRLK
jgi:ribosomal protein L24